MKLFLIGLGVVVIGGLVYWLVGQGVAEAPGTEPATADVDRYIGLSEGEAEEVAITNGVLFRVVERDGQMLPATRDFREGRINAVVEDGNVVSYTVETNQATSDTSEPEVSGDEAAAEVDAEVDTESDNNIITEHDGIIGMTQAEAEAYAENINVPFRIGSVDGEMRPLTMDYRPGRITAAVESGVVTSYTVE